MYNSALTICMIVLAWTAAAFAQGPTSTAPRVTEIQIVGYRWLSRHSSASIVDPNQSETVTVMGKSTVNATKLKTSISRYYIYEIKLKNSSGRNVKGVSWDHVFTDLENQSELRRHKLLSAEKVGAGKTVTIQNMSGRPPTDIVRANDLGKDGKPPYRESVALRCVLFDDYSIWRTGGATDEECEVLRQGIMVAERPAKKNK